MVNILLTGFSVFAAPPDNFTATMVYSGMEMPMAKMGIRSRVENPCIKYNAVFLPEEQTRRKAQSNNLGGAGSQRFHYSNRIYSPG
ncbi:MAG: hypothetical protein KKE00_07640 [Proteobacteria bacterium]|nr:hypothetical protein [Pseudomonadota bacterium]MBU1397834.1 hypothetical protein [Pseudomonadota bacterium]MBU1570372.1 hypothetical protein [Pseudomonadota bacterium]